MSNPLHNQILKDLMDRFYGNPLISNIWRGHYVEGLIYCALSDNWKLGADWDGWDLENDAGVRLEVKQSTACQTWQSPRESGKRSSTSFDIAPRTGYWTPDGVWVDLPGRLADIYVFAWHPETNPDIADHRCANQWRFFVVPEHKLKPGQKNISLNPVKRLAPEITYDRLAEAIDTAVSTLPALKAKMQDINQAKSINQMPSSEANAAAVAVPTRRSGSGQTAAFNVPTLIDSFSDDHVQQAVRRLIEVASNMGATIRRRNAGVSIRLLTAIYGKQIDLAWLNAPLAIRVDTKGWMTGEGFFFGAGDGTKAFFGSLPTALRDVLDNWVNQFSRDAFGTDGTGSSDTGLKVRSIPYEAAAANIDVLAERLENVLRDLQQLE